MKKTLTELYIEAENAKKELNAAILSDSVSQIEGAKKAMDTAVKEYNDTAVIMDYETLKSKSAPMLAAIEQLTIACIEAKRNEDKDTKIVTYSIEPVNKQISLPAFDEYCGREKLQIAPDRLWIYSVEQFCLLITYRIMKELGGDTRKLMETYYISDIARQIDLGETPMSNSKILKQLQTIVDGIIYEAEGGKNIYKVTSHDVCYIVQTMTRRGKVSGTVVAPKPATMHTLIMDVLHRIVTDAEYKVEYVTKKQAKAESGKDTQAETEKYTDNTPGEIEKAAKDVEILTQDGIKIA